MVWIFRTLGMFTFLTVLLMAVGAVVGWLCGGYYMVGMGITGVIALVMCFYSYFFSKQNVIRSQHVRLVEEYEEPRLHSIIRDVAQRAGLPMPQVGIVYSPVPNAFATGRGPNDALVCATTGLLNMLPDNEIRGVIAHEMSHVRNRDILVMSVASFVATMITYLAHVAYFAAIFAPNNDNENGAARLLVGLAMNLLLPIAAILVQLGVSRNREYLADKSGAEIIQDPRSLADALKRISGMPTSSDAYTEGKRETREQRQNDPFSVGNSDSIYDCAHMWIASPLNGRAGGFMNLFSTHPPMEERIARLEEMASKIGM